MLPPLISAFSFAARNLSGERVEVRCPEPAERLQPLVDVAQRLGVHGVQPALAVGSHRRETIVAQHFQVLRYCRLANRELGLNGSADGTRRLLTVGQQFQDPPPHWIAEDVERVHPPKIEDFTYISQA